MCDRAQQLFEEAWETGTDCEGCPQFKSWEEHHPYGMGTAAEPLCDCMAANPSQCPFVERKLAEDDNLLFLKKQCD